jgi:transglutaminase-like putative cysteine protease
LAAVAALAASAGDGPIFQSAATRAGVEARFKAQRALAANRDAALFGVMNGRLSQAERDAMTFLYAYMPLQDLADHDGDFFLRAVRATLAARENMPWGESVPEDVFLSFVLPLRVNNENLDEARPELYKMLKERVQGLELDEAILEVNHWCHERVTYQGTDGRTSGPLSTIRTSWGRCGEESVLVVAALRAVGIPARQVYTPRWAHVDDNHAWVEAWVDGEWRYLGACEPEPALDMAWFREPARRAMMVHTKVYGGSKTSDFKVRGNQFFDELQLLETYAPVEERRVRVVDLAKKPVQGAVVDFGLYNYAEFYPLASLTTNAQGRAMLPSGRGDLRIWARKGDQYGSGLLKADAVELVVELAPFKGGEKTDYLDIVPPSEPFPHPPTAPPEAVEANRRRLQEEDRAREAYIATFATEKTCRTMGAELELDFDRLWPLLKKSAGNHREIAAFLAATPEDDRPWAIALLEEVSDKDLRDTPASVLRDHMVCLDGLRGDFSRDDLERFAAYVLSPRIHLELLRPWRSGLRGFFGESALGTFRQNPSKAVDWVKANVKVDDTANWCKVPMRPLGVAELKVADSLGRDILFVAICRTAGIPARLEPGTYSPQFFQGAWKKVGWGGPAVAPKTGTVTITGHLEPEPKYMSHFALARFTDGRWQTLDYEDEPWNYFQDGLALEPGPYCLTTGNRQSDGSVLIRQAYFDLKENESRVVPLAMRPSKPPRSHGAIDLDVALPSIPLAEPGSDWEEGRPFSLKGLSNDAGLILAWLGEGDEPTRHAMSDLEQLREAIEKWGGGLALCLQALPKGEQGHLATVRGMAEQTRLLLDDGGMLLAEVQGAIKRQPSVSLPVIMGVSKDGNVIYYSEGYRIGAGEQVLKAIRSMGAAN